MTIKAMAPMIIVKFPPELLDAGGVFTMVVIVRAPPFQTNASNPYGIH